MSAAPTQEDRAHARRARTGDRGLSSRTGRSRRPTGSKSGAWPPAPSSTTRPNRTSRGSGRAQAASCSRGRGLGHHPRVEPAVREVVRRRQAQRRRTTASTATWRRARGDKVAFHWEGEPGDTRTITYADLLAEVQRFANVLKSLGVQKGDRVNIYMPMIPELPIALLACARIGAPHSVVFGGFSPDSLVRPHQRRRGEGPRSPPTAAGAAARSSPLKANADVAVADTPSIEHVVVVRRTDERRAHGADGRDHWYHDLMADADGRLPGRADGQRGPPVPALHVGHDGEAQGHHAHDRRLPHPGRVHAQVRVRPPPRRRRLLVRGRHRLGHRPQLHRLRPARQRRHRR